MTPAIAVLTAPYGHPHHGRPLIVAGHTVIAWSDSPVRAEIEAEFFREHPALVAALAEEAK